MKVYVVSRNDSHWNYALFNFKWREPTNPNEDIYHIFDDYCKTNPKLKHIDLQMEEVYGDGKWDFENNYCFQNENKKTICLIIVNEELENTIRESLGVE